jgi:hypothetical protein
MLVFQATFSSKEDKRMISQRLQHVVGALVLLASSPILTADQAPAAASPPGDLWKVTSQMSMEGMDMQMPAQNSQVCAPKDWNEPPAGANQQPECQNSDFIKDGDKVTWKISCTDEVHTSGEGEITRAGDDAYTGSIKFTSDRGNMTIALTGSRLGDCDNPNG